jgi:hypothetical protein
MHACLINANYLVAGTDQSLLPLLPKLCSVDVNVVFRPLLSWLLLRRINILPLRDNGFVTVLPVTAVAGGTIRSSSDTASLLSERA